MILYNTLADFDIKIAAFGILGPLLLTLWMFSGVRKSEVKFSIKVSRSKRGLMYLTILMVSFIVVILTTNPVFISLFIFVLSLVVVTYISNHSDINNYKTGVLESLGNFLICGVCFGIGYFFYYITSSGFCSVNSTIDFINCAMGFVPNLIGSTIFFTFFSLLFSLLYPLKFIKSESGALDDMNF